MSKNIRRQAEDISFSDLKADPSAYKGRTVILGGYVAEVENLEKSSRLMLLQAPLDLQDKPGDRQRSQGRFMAVTKRFLDPMVYEKGRKVTTAGTVEGTASEKVGEYVYKMPLLKSREIHLWERDRPRRRCMHDPFYPWADDYFFFGWHYPCRW